MLLAFLSGRISELTAIFLLVGIIIALSFHEFSHAFAAKKFGDNTAQQAGRLTLNPIVHIDPFGLLLVIIVGFGYARPVPTNPDNFTSNLASPVIAFAGPASNLLLAFLVVNFWQLGLKSGVDMLINPHLSNFCRYFVYINLLLFLFNMLPIGALDGHYIAEYLLPKKISEKYSILNSKFGNFLLLSLIVVSFLGFPLFYILADMADSLSLYLTIV